MVHSFFEDDDNQVVKVLTREESWSPEDGKDNTEGGL